MNPISPSYYQFPDGHEVRHISAHLTSYGGQAVQYVSRSCRLDGNNKGDPIENISKAIRLLEWERERLRALNESATDHRIVINGDPMGQRLHDQMVKNSYRQQLR